MNSYFISTWRVQLTGRARQRAEKAIRALDPEAGIVCIDQPGNDVRMWLERPNDGTNDHADVQHRNRRLVEIVNKELGAYTVQDPATGALTLAYRRAK